jgi:hypothetical protein
VSLERHRISVSQLSELLGVDPKRFVAVQRVCSREFNGWEVVTEGGEMNTSGTFPQLNQGGKTKKGKGKKR